MNQHSWLRLTSAAAALCLIGNLASAAPITTITVTPTSPEAVNGSVKANSTTGAPGFGTSSFQEKNDGKSDIYFSATELFGSVVTISQIASISYWTDKAPGSSTAGLPDHPRSPDVDWSLYLYTDKTGTGDTGSFYHSRLTAEPLYSNGTYTANVWHQWSTNDPDAPLRFYDYARDGSIAGTNNDPTFSTLLAGGGAYTWSSSGTSNNYNPETIEFFSLQTGSDWAQGFTGLVDGLTITLTDGRVGRVDLSDGLVAAAVPEPESMALLFIGLAGALAVARRRRPAA